MTLGLIAPAVHQMSITSKHRRTTMLDDLTRSVKEAVIDGINNPEHTTGSGFFENILTRFKGRLLFSAIFFLVFGAVAIFIILMVVFFVFKSM